MGIQNLLICLLRNLYGLQKVTVRIRHRTMDWFKIGKGVHQAVYCHPAYLTYMQSTSCIMLGWENHKLESRLPGELSTTTHTHTHTHTHTYIYEYEYIWHRFNDRKQRGTKEPWWGWKRRVKCWLITQYSKSKDHGIQSHHFMENKWGKSWTMTGFIFLGSKICRPLLQPQN